MRPSTLLAAALAAAAVSMPTAASAAPVCAGTTGTEYVCVDPLGRTLYSDCVYVGSPPCTPVNVPGPAVSCDGVLDCRVFSVCFATIDICLF